MVLAIGCPVRAYAGRQPRPASDRRPAARSEGVARPGGRATALKPHAARSDGAPNLSVRRLPVSHPRRNHRSLMKRRPFYAAAIATSRRTSCPEPRSRNSRFGGGCRARRRPASDRQRSRPSRPRWAAHAFAGDVGPHGEGNRDPQASDPRCKQPASGSRRQGRQENRPGATCSHDRRAA